jgi:hypothetical protein
MVASDVCVRQLNTEATENDSSICLFQTAGKRVLRASAVQSASVQRLCFGPRLPAMCVHVCVPTGGIRVCIVGGPARRVLYHNLISLSSSYPTVVIRLEISDERS